jgi:shikimate dehydrogenase
MDSHREVYTVGDLRSWTRTIAPIQLAVLGAPVAHSASPPMHMAALKACGLPHTYGRIHVPPEEITEAIHLLKQTGFLGVNLTIPHKTAVLPLLSSIDPKASELGAVNTVVLGPGTASGFNTDGAGLERSIVESFGVSLSDLSVLILGAGGGAGRAIALYCGLAGCPEITLVNRTIAKAEELARQLRALPSPPRVHVCAPGSEELSALTGDAQLILQCSSLGMHQDDPSPLDGSSIRKDHLVYDTIYSTPTRLLSEASAKGARTANGLSMLLHQGALAFEIWFRRTAPLESMREALHRALPPTQR